MAKAKDDSAKLNIRRWTDRIVSRRLEARNRQRAASSCPTREAETARGKVLAAGPGKMRDDGTRAVLAVAVGDEVLFGRYAGNDVEVNNKELKIMRESDVLAKVVK